MYFTSLLQLSNYAAHKCLCGIAKEKKRKERGFSFKFKLTDRAPPGLCQGRLILGEVKSVLPLFALDIPFCDGDLNAVYHPNLKSLLTFNTFFYDYLFLSIKVLS